MSTAAQAKFNMIEQQIRPWEVLDPRVLSVLQQLDRADFVCDLYKGLAYADCQIPINQNVRMLPPVVEGRMLQALLIKEKDQVLEVGCASGYIAACLANLGKQVTSIDTDSALIETARQNLSMAGLGNVELENQSYSELSVQKSYDVIAVNASLASVPENLKQALNIGGRMFIVTGHSPAMQALLITRVGEAEWRTQSLFETDLPRLAG